MEVPKHTTQVGTIAANKKLYIEDYCISYMKQLGEEYPEDRKQIALFGIVQREKSIEYAFAYGAAMLGKGRGRTDSLTNSQKEEAESFREEFFPEYQLLGVVIGTDSVNETVYWLGNGNKSIPLDGYYIFYDKNEAMLNFMMHNQKEERDVDLDPVIIKKADMDREKREKKEKEEAARQEAAQQRSGIYRKKIQSAEQAVRVEKHRKRSPFPVAACLLVVAITGIYGVKTYYPEVGMEQVKSYFSELRAKASIFTNSYLDGDEVTEGLFVQNETTETVATDETALAEGQDILVVSGEVQSPAELDVIIIPEPDAVESNQGQQENASTENVQQETNQAETAVQETVSQENSQQESVPAVQERPEKYLIKKGDNLLRILRTYYGDESKLLEICNINGIVDPNNIQVGQTILLP